MKKTFFAILPVIFLFLTVCFSEAQVKSPKKTKIEKDEKTGKQVGEGGQVTRPSQTGKQLGKDGQVARPEQAGKQTGKSGEVTRPAGSLGTPKVYNGAASLVFFYFGDSPEVTLAQETMELYRAMKDYNYIVLLKHEKVAGKYEVSQTALKKADVVDLPTSQNLVKYFKELTQKGYFIDVWIFSHGSPDKWFRTSTGTDGSADMFTENDIRNLPQNTGFSYIPIRMVYQVNCYGYNLIEAWRSIGAKTALGARLVNFYPYEFSRFTTQWNQGKSFKESRDKAEENTPKDPTNNYIRDFHAPEAKRAGEWSGCPTGYNVLGTTDTAKECGKEYFTKVWELPWQDDGKSTMEYASWKIVAGDYNITKNTVPEW